jgi:hypothetical protein
MTDLERLEAVAAYADEIARLVQRHDQHAAVCVGVMSGFMLGCRLGLGYPVAAREMAVALEGGMQIDGSPMPKGLGEAAEEMNRQLCDVIGGPD